MILKSPPKFRERIAGVDWGYNDPGVLLEVGITDLDEFVVYNETYEREQQIEFWHNKFLEAAKRGVTLFYADPSRPEYIKSSNDFLQDRGFHHCRFLAGSNSRYVGIMFVSSLLRSRTVITNTPKLLVRDTCVNLIEELGSYKWAENPQTMELTEEPERNQREHACDALRYATYTHVCNNSRDFHHINLDFLSR